VDYGLPILAYHKVDSRRELGITALSPRRFERQIRFLKHEGCACISLPGVWDSGFAIRDFQESKISKPVLITFDDGYEGIYTHAYPILKKYASTAIIFLTTGYIGKYNSWDASPGPRFKHLDWIHIREMADDGICFGSHGVNHTFLTRQNDSTVKYEIEASKKKLEDGLGRPVRFFSYPYGDYDDRIIDSVQEAGYEAAFSLRPELLKFGYTVSKSVSSLAGADPISSQRGRTPPFSSFAMIPAYAGIPRLDPATRDPQNCLYMNPSSNALIDQNIYALPRIAIYLLDNMRAFKAKIGCGRGGLVPYTQKMKNQLINKCAYASVLVKNPGSKTI
jgi:peptidoglycan/xylan/chitin deacetylase (PgdA/CDA1 family)